MSRGEEIEAGTSSTHSTGEGGPERERLVFIWGDGATSIALSEGRPILVGRSRKCDVRVDLPSLSREHATFAFEDGHLAVTDHGSKNGTVVDGVPIAKERPVGVAPRAVVRIGDAVAIYEPRRDPPDSPLTAAWREIDRLLPLVARGNISVLVLGETGAGKEVTANALHRMSRRARGPFVTIHCAALPESLLEAELFGYERGAFTGATSSKAGLLESADGGTAFLDEIGEIPLSTQAKLLRAVETKLVTKLGSLRAKTVDIRFVAATNRDVSAMVEAGTFREDLYYRLAGFTLHVPSLRARLGEIERIAERFARESSRSLGREAPRIGQEALSCMRRYAWPGNIRELRNAIEGAVLLCEGDVIRAEHLPARVTNGPSAALRGGGARSLPEEIEELERKRILEALERAGGNQSRAARSLGISRRLLLDRLDAYATPRPRKGVGARVGLGLKG